jgi:hypothetical protein
MVNIADVPILDDDGVGVAGPNMLDVTGPDVFDVAHGGPDVRR